ncbi:MAG TPA: cysteine hydrolase family protein [Kaistiaceae bacterium]|nr:cysteine hydrolase family protein [Kaistiaceae bacterium]
MTEPKTLFQLAGFEPRPAGLDAAVLVFIDYQNEYLEGPLRLSGVDAAVESAGRLLDAARAAGTRIIHVAHKGGAGGPFDRSAPRGSFIARLDPIVGEAVVEKPRPNAFSETELATLVGGRGARVIVAGFMTHMCLASTVRAALDLGLTVTVAADACATRDLPVPGGGIVAAADLHAAELAALGDRFAAVAPVAAILAASQEAAPVAG